MTVILDDSISIYELTPRFEQSLYRFEIAENEAPQDLGKVQVIFLLFSKTPKVLRIF